MKSTDQGPSIVIRSAINSAVLCTVACLLLFGALFQVQKRIHEARLVSDVEQNIAQVTSFLLGYFYAQGNWIHLEEHQAKLNAAPNTLYSYIVGMDGKVEIGISGLQSPEIGRQRETWEPDLQTNPVTKVGRVQFAANRELVAKFQKRVNLGDKITLISAPIIRPSTGEKCAELRVAITHESISGTLANLGRTLVIVAVLLATFTGLIVFVITKRNLSPIKLISQKMQNLAQKMVLISTNGVYCDSAKLESNVLVEAHPQDAQETRFFKSSLVNFTEAFQRTLELSNEVKMARSLSDLAAQVAHDIRSPLTALAIAAEDLSQLPEAKRVLVRSAVTRISDIANNLLERQRQSPKKQSPSRVVAADMTGMEPFIVALLPSLIDVLLTEKRMQFRSHLGVEIAAKLDARSYGLFARIQPTEFGRVLSNLINNSVEAIDGRGTVSIALDGATDHIEIIVSDSGRGIPVDVLPRLMLPGMTFEKRDGSGLGLHHAKSSVERWGGRMEIASSLGRGTTVTIQLPRTEAPIWFVPELTIRCGNRIVIVDDDASIHQVWKERFSNDPKLRDQVEFFHFSSPVEVASWYGDNDHSRSTLFLVDYEFLGQMENGLGLIRNLGIQNSSVLVTSRFEEKAVMDECDRLGVRLIPKGMAGYVPINLVDETRRLDAVLIDDDPLVRETWKVVAMKYRKRIGLFEFSTDFMAVADTFDRSTPIYVDAQLGDGKPGERVTFELWQRGFRELYLATGLPAHRFGNLPWIRDVLGKEPPWSRSPRT